jgi:Glycosyl hydrolases family 2, sugar binding domain/Glycosyl hydrolases family 2/Glycosyl hydrolases family 2, TIM barrel domain
MRLPTLLFSIVCVDPALAADWKPAPVPIQTRWAKEVKPDKVLPEYPRPQMVRKDWVNLNGLWDYAITAKDAAKPEKWDGQILVPFCIESSLSGVGKTISDVQALWYRRTFKAPKLKDSGRLLLNFGAVDWHCKVTLNSKPVGEHKGGFDPFTFDITDALKPEGEQELVVWVWDPTDAGSQPVGKQIRNPHGIWYTAVTGIWQTVWLEPIGGRGVPWIKSVRFKPDIDAGEVEILVEAEGANHGISVKWTEARPDKKGAYHHGPVNKPFRVKLDTPKLWTPDDPHLYEVEVDAWNGGRALDDVDKVHSYFAMRKISAAKDDKGVLRLMLNNKPLFQLGPLDQGWWPDGLYTAPTDEALAYDLKVLKDLGMNMLRKHIKVEPSRLYYHCDKLGLMVWQDMPSVINRNKKHFVAPNGKDADFTAEEKLVFDRELKAMMDHLSFFPCIVGWVPFNEGWGQHDTNEVLKRVMEADPTRLVDGPSGWADRGFGHMKDLHQYPGPGMFPIMPDRVSVLGEFGGLGLPLKGHLWKDSDNWGYRTYKTTEELRENYRRLMVQLHPLIGKGLSAAVYTQTTDVEIEVNGLMTYDREVLKLDAKETAKWHKALYGPAPIERVLVETSEKVAQKWKYALATPQAGWERGDFDDRKWMEGEGGFGTSMTPGSVVRTEWKSNDIWLRREVELKAAPTGEVFFRLHHDEDADIYINGVLAGRVDGYVTEYGLLPMTTEGRKALKVGKNNIAVHCKQTGGGQYIDVGLVELIAGK